ncbi:MAG: histone deacetylase [Cyclobacteriaceae bacterium]
MKDFKIAFSAKHVYQLPAGHRFPIAKYSLVHDQLLYEGVINTQQVLDAGLIGEEILLSTHTPAYWQKLVSQTLSEKEVRKIGLPVHEQSIKRARNTVQGTLFASQQALQMGLGLNLAGGTHHAYPGHGEGFCIFNDIAVAANYILQEKLAARILIIDLDVHQGNGTAVIFQQQPRVFTFSMHGKNNYPHKKENSDLDIELEKGTGDDKYLQILQVNLNQLIDQFQPDLIFYQAGVDVLSTDLLGTLALSKSGCRQRDEMVIEKCHHLQIPLVIVMGGGYSRRLADIVDAHCNTCKTAIDIYH